jgi:glycosyltransferase involved in cell wall biosynthesis|tara:strand:+ start:11897 stop:12634 length:738 start_codon:yes stop_codon:yes gene_type:complete
MKITICTLTFNSEKTIKDLLLQLSKLSCEIIAVDSGSTDKTLDVLKEFENVKIFKKEYKYHSEQMNYATSLSNTDWVLCLDSDEVPSNEFIEKLKKLLENFDFTNSTKVGRIKRKWIVLGKEVHAMYPCSSPDYVVRFYNKKQCAFNDRIVDDKVKGFNEGTDDFILDGSVNHYTFETIEIMNKKLQSYVNRTRDITKKRSRIRGVISAIGAFIKWYFRKKSYLDGYVGIQTTWYAVKYSYYKYI